MCCPYFYPRERTAEIAWSFPGRLPLGGGFRGECRAGTAPAVPDDATLRESCNLGYARGCSRLPASRTMDSVRLAVGQDREDKIHVLYVADREHAPVAHGELVYDCAARRWVSTSDDPCVQRQAECYLETYLQRRGR